jgi:hypothetical protein
MFPYYICWIDSKCHDRIPGQSDLRTNKISIQRNKKIHVSLRLMLRLIPTLIIILQNHTKIGDVAQLVEHYLMQK